MSEESIMQNQTIKVEAEIDLSKDPSECRVKAISGNAWEDFGYWLECSGFMAFTAMKQREWSQAQILDYSREYLEKCLNDYKIKSLPSE